MSIEISSAILGNFSQKTIFWNKLVIYFLFKFWNFHYHLCIDLDKVFWKCKYFKVFSAVQGGVSRGYDGIKFNPSTVVFFFS